MIVLWLIDGYSKRAEKDFFYRGLLRAARGRWASGKQLPQSFLRKDDWDFLKDAVRAKCSYKYESDSLRFVLSRPFRIRIQQSAAAGRRFRGVEFYCQ